MIDLLEELNAIPGVQGSMVITRDGIMVASALHGELQEDAVAALSSSLVITLRRSLAPLDARVDAEEMILAAEKGKLVFLSLGEAFLVVVTQPNLRLNTDLVDIRSIARKLRSRCVMS